MKELTVDFITACPIHRMSKKKEMESQQDDTAMLSCEQNPLSLNCVVVQVGGSFHTLIAK